MKTARAFVLFISIWQCAGMVPLLKLNNGRSIPAIGLGTYLGFDNHGLIKSVNKQLRDVIVSAIDLGCRHFDTASVYKTEDEVGEGVRLQIDAGKITRDEVFVTTKLWNDQHERNQVEPALRESLKLMGLEYIDLYLMHWPMGISENGTFENIDFLETWRGMEEVYRKGLTKAIGVSNFNIKQLKRLLDNCDIKPAALQIEIHPQLIQTDLVSFSQSNGLVVMGFSPFGSLVSRFNAENIGSRIDQQVLQNIANKYGKGMTQVALRWQVDRGIIPIPKTLSIRHLQTNIDVFDFHLTEDEISKINGLDAGLRFTIPTFWQNHTHYPFEKTDVLVPNPLGI